MNKEVFINYRTELKLAVIFIVLGFLAIFLGDPYKKPELKVNFTDVEAILKQPVKQISPIDLAKFMMKANEPYRLVDLRPKDEFNRYKIPGAEHIELNSLKDLNLFVNERVILYTTNENEATQAYFVLIMQSYFKVSVLKGGIERWKNDVLFPVAPESETEFAEQKKITTFFGGQIIEKGKSGLDSLNLPKPIYVQKPAFDPESCG